MGRTGIKLTSLFGNAVRPDAAPSQPASQTRHIDNYEIEKCLGTGGMGTVYKARDEKLDRVVALKVMLKDLGSDPSILEAFRKEARAVAKLNHPNIAQIYSFGEDDGKPYIVMEFVGGEHFDSLVFSPTPLDQAKVMKTGMEIASGLQVAADAGLVHGDIKPENIVFDDHGVPKLLDFGIASASNAIVIGFNVRPDSGAKALSEQEKVDIRTYRVIYQAIEDVQNAMTGLFKPVYQEVTLGTISVRNTFKVSGVGTIAGAYVSEGKVQRNAQVRVVRDGIVIHEGKIASLRRFKDDVKEVAQGYECGISIENFNDIHEGDVIEAFVMEEVKR